MIALDKIPTGATDNLYKFGTFLGVALIVGSLYEIGADSKSSSDQLSQITQDWEKKAIECRDRSKTAYYQLREESNKHFELNIIRNDTWREQMLQVQKRTNELVFELNKAGITPEKKGQFKLEKDNLTAESELLLRKLDQNTFLRERWDREFDFKLDKIARDTIFELDMIQSQYTSKSQALVGLTGLRLRVLSYIGYFGVIVCLTCVYRWYKRYQLPLDTLQQHEVKKAELEATKTLQPDSPAVSAEHKSEVSGNTIPIIENTSKVVLDEKPLSVAN